MKKSGYKGGSKMPNSSHGHGASPTKPHHTGGGTINMASDMRPDGSKNVSNRHPYPNGIS